MRILNNIKWDVNKFMMDVETKFRAVESDGRLPYGILIHPKTFIDVVSDESYRAYVHFIPLQDGTRFCGHKVVCDPDMPESEFELLVREP